MTVKPIILRKFVIFSLVSDMLTLRVHASCASTLKFSSKLKSIKIPLQLFLQKTFINLTVLEEARQRCLNFRQQWTGKGVKKKWLEISRKT